jgi:Uma2 family endonuclease
MLSYKEMAMASIPDSDYPTWTASEVIARFGDIPISRICTDPPPGAATEADVIEQHERHDRLCELIDGTLVEKTMGWREAFIATWIATVLNNFVVPRKLGRVFGPDGMFRFEPDQIRIPDVAYISKQRYANRSSSDAFWDLGCDLAVEVISPSNTRREMERKLSDYFAAGVQLVWLVYLNPREVVAYTSPTESRMLRGDDVLDGGPALPGFSVPVAQIFDALDATGA